MIISTDSTANLPKDYYKKLNIKMIPMQIVLENKVYNDLSTDLPLQEYYEKMRQGATPTTAQINEFSAKEYFEDLLNSGEDVLHISFSSALSGTTATLMRVANELNQTNKNKIVVVDSLNASMGEGLLVLKANELLQQNKTIDEIAEEIKALIPKVKSYFTVDQLKYLVRGGRISKLSGTIGALLHIKPILKVDENGKLVSFKKVISRKKAISELINLIKAEATANDTIYFTHAMCFDEANTVAEEIKKSGFNAIITDLTQVIGCHTGPGLIAAFFFSNNKKTC